MHVIHTSGKRSIFLAKLRGTQKWPPWAPKMIFFHPDLFFVSGLHPRQLFFARKTHSFWSIIASGRSPVQKKKHIQVVATLYYISPPKQQRNIVQLCTNLHPGQCHRSLGSLAEPCTGIETLCHHCVYPKQVPQIRYQHLTLMSY